MTRRPVRPRYVVETEAQSVRNGSWWWFGIYCLPNWRKHWTRMHGDYVPIAAAKAMNAGVISLREAVRLHRKGLV